MKLTKTLSPNVLFSVFLVSIIIGYFFHGALVDVFSIIGFVCLILAIATYFKKRKAKKIK